MAPLLSIAVRILETFGAQIIFAVGAAFDGDFLLTADTANRSFLETLPPMPGPLPFPVRFFPTPIAVVLLTILLIPLDG